VNCGDNQPEEGAGVTLLRAVFALIMGGFRPLQIISSGLKTRFLDLRPRVVNFKKRLSRLALLLWRQGRQTDCESVQG